MTDPDCDSVTQSIRSCDRDLEREFTETSQLPRFIAEDAVLIYHSKKRSCVEVTLFSRTQGCGGLTLV